MRPIILSKAMISRRLQRFLTSGNPVPLAALLTIALLATACDKVPLTAPTDTTITLFNTGTSVPLNGSIDIIASVIESAGTPVQNGTVVTFTTTLGHLEPAEARTNAGKVTVKLVSDGKSGTATVKAFSGSAASEGLDVPMGAAAATRITLVSTPGSLGAGGGTATLTATVRDASSNAVVGVPVTFTTDAGQLGVSTVLTNGNGEASTTLTTAQTAQVTAAIGDATVTLTVKVTAAPTITVTPAPAAPAAGEPVTFTITVTPADGGLPIKSVSIDFGDGSRQELGTGTTTASHVYRSSGSYSVRTTVTDSANQATSQVIVLVVTDAASIAVTITAEPATATRNEPVTFTATVPTGVEVDEYVWNFGNGKTAKTTGNNASTVYDRVGNFTVTVTVSGSNGTDGAGQTVINVQ
jgi:PKD repeat protein